MEGDPGYRMHHVIGILRALHGCTVCSKLGRVGSKVQLVSEGCRDFHLAQSKGYGHIFVRYTCSHDLKWTGISPDDGRNPCNVPCSFDVSATDL